MSIPTPHPPIHVCLGLLSRKSLGVIESKRRWYGCFRYGLPRKYSKWDILATTQTAVHSFTKAEPCKEHERSNDGVAFMLTISQISYVFGRSPCAGRVHFRYDGPPEFGLYRRDDFFRRTLLLLRVAKYRAPAPRRKATRKKVYHETKSFFSAAL